ncbi:TATA-box-binding family protein, partial [Methanosalsum natronophilum]
MEVVSAIAVVTLNKPLNLEHLQEFILDSVLQKTNISCLKYRLQPENRYIVFYKTGKFLITGRNVLDEKDSIVERVMKLIKASGIEITVDNVKICNIVAKDSIYLSEPLDTIYERMEQKNSEYEPEQFPALIYKKWNVTFLIFQTGSIIITGAKDIESLQQGL